MPCRSAPCWQLSEHNCPGRVPGWRRVGDHRAGAALQHGAAPRRAGAGRLRRAADQRSCLHRAERTHRQRLRPHRDQRRDLPPAAARRSSSSTSGGCPATRNTTSTAGRRRRADSASAANRTRCSATRLSRSTRRCGPYFENPTACGEARSTLGVDALFYDKTLAHAEGVWPSTTGCDQLTFNPSLTAKPTTTQADSASGLDVDLEGPADAEPDARRRPPRSERRRSRFPAASRSTRTRPTARPPAPTQKAPSAPSTARAVPRALQGRHRLDSTARPCRRRSPARSTSGSRCPATGTGCS